MKALELKFTSLGGMGLILTAWHHVSVRTELHHKVWFVVYNSGWLVHVRMDNWLGTIEVATWKGNLAIQRHCAIRHTLRVDRQSSSQTGGNYDDMGEADIPTKLQINFRLCLKHPCQQTSLNGAAGCTPLYSLLPYPNLFWAEVHNALFPHLIKSNQFFGWLQLAHCFKLRVKIFNVWTQKQEHFRWTKLN